MAWPTSHKIALGIGFGLIGVALACRVLGVARPILMALHLLSLAICSWPLLDRVVSGSRD